MPMQPTDRIMARPRGSLADVIGYFRRLGGVKRWSDFIVYAQEIYATAPRVGLDPSILIAQAAHETGNFTSKWWVERLNPAGLGITGTPAQDNLSRTFENGVQAARAQMAHMMMYVAGKVSYPLLPGDDPRYDAYVQRFGHQPTATVISDFGGGIWATDPEYDIKIVKKGNTIFKNLPASSLADGILITPAVGTMPLRVGGLLWDGTRDVEINGVTFHGERRIVTIGVDNLNIRVYADTNQYSPILRIARRGQKIEVIGWVVGEKVGTENRWWIGADHTRIWVGGTVEKPS